MIWIRVPLPGRGFRIIYGQAIQVEPLAFITTHVRNIPIGMMWVSDADQKSAWMNAFTTPHVPFEQPFSCFVKPWVG